MAYRTTADACMLAELVTPFVQALEPVHRRYDSLAGAWEELLPGELRSHCRLDGLSRGSLRVLVDGPAYRCELQWCQKALLRELQQLCPSAHVQRIVVGLAR